jgi:sporulation protein YunB
MKFKKIKRVYYYSITIFLIFFCAFNLLKIYYDKSNTKIKEIAVMYLKRNINNSLSNLGTKLINKDTIDDILLLHKNNDDEILYVDYNMQNTYKLLNDVTQNIRMILNQHEYPNQGMIIKLPVFIASDYALISNLGPKITITINYIDSILTNIYSKITNYGMNNALVEAYIKVSITGQIITPVGNYEEVVDYDMLIASKVINGRVPLYYGGIINANSSILDIPIKY